MQGCGLQRLPLSVQGTSVGPKWKLCNMIQHRSLCSLSFSGDLHDLLLKNLHWLHHKLYKSPGWPCSLLYFQVRVALLTAVFSGLARGQTHSSLSTSTLDWLTLLSGFERGHLSGPSRLLSAFSSNSSQPYPCLRVPPGINFTE